MNGPSGTYCNKEAAIISQICDDFTTIKPIIGDSRDIHIDAIAFVQTIENYMKLNASSHPQLDLYHPHTMAIAPFSYEQRYLYNFFLIRKKYDVPPASFLLLTFYFFKQSFINCNYSSKSL